MIRKSLLAATMVGAAALLAACGGGGSGPAATTSVPGAVSTSATDFVTYLMALVVSPADDLEPVDINSVSPATSDTTEPETIQ